MSHKKYIIDIKHQLQAVKKQKQYPTLHTNNNKIEYIFRHIETMKTLN